MGAISEKAHYRASSKRWNGMMIAAIIREVAVVADAVSNASTVTDSYKVQRDLQNSLLNIAEEQQNLLKNYYWPKELTFLEEFCTPEEVEEVNVYGRRFAGHLMAAVAKTFAQQIKQIKCSMGRYHTSHYVTTLQMTYQSQATAMANAKVLGFIKGFAYAQAKNNTNDQRRLQAIGLGRNLMQQAAALYKNALGGLAGVSGLALRGLGNSLEEFGAGLKDITNLYKSRPEEPEEEQTIDFMTAAQNAWSNYGESSGWGVLFGGGGSGSGSLMSTFSSSAESAGEDTGLQENTMTDSSNSLLTNDYSVSTASADDYNGGYSGSYNVNKSGSHTYKWKDSDGDENELTINLDTDFGWVRSDPIMMQLKDSTYNPTNDNK